MARQYRRKHEAEHLIQMVIDMLIDNSTELKSEFKTLTTSQKFYFIERVLPTVNKYIEIERDASGEGKSTLEEKQDRIQKMIQDFKNSAKMANA